MPDPQQFKPSRRKPDMDLWQDILLILPLYLANAALLILWRLKIFDRLPVFRSKIFRAPFSERLFGKVRNLQGLAFIVIATAAGYWLITGSLLLLPGVLMYLGMLANSFMKRRLGLAWGSPFPPFDQLDFLAGGLLGLYLSGYYVGSILFILLLTFFLHIFSNMIAYKLGLKDVWW